MSDNPAAILFDVSGIPTAVSGGMSMPTTGALGHMVAGLDTSGFVRYMTVTSGSLQVTGSVGVSGITFPESVTVTVTSSLPVTVGNFPATQAVSLAAPVTVTNPATVGVSGTVGVNNFPLTQNVSGSVTLGGYGAGVTGSVFVTATGSLPVAVVGTVPVSVAQTLVVSTSNGQEFVTVSGMPAVSFAGAQPVFNQSAVGVSGSVTVTSTGSLAVAAPSYAPVWVTGAVALNPTPTINAATTTTGTAGLAVGNAPYQPLFVTGSVALNPTPVITANTATTGSSGLAVGNAPYQPLYVTGSVALNPTPTINAATTTTGSAGLAVGNAPYQPLWVTLTASLPVSVAGTLPVSFAGPQPVFESGTVGVSGSVTVGGWANNVTGTISGTVGAVIENWPASFGVSGALSLAGAQPVFNAGPVGVSGTVGVNNFPAVQAVSGSITLGGYGLGVTGSTFVTTTGSLPVAVVGTVPVTVAQTLAVSMSNGQEFVTVTNLPATQPVSIASPVSVFSAGTVGVSGTVGINNFPLTQGVSGTVTVGGYSAGVTGSVFITSTGSIPVTFGALPQLQVSNFPAVQAVSGNVSVAYQAGVTGSTFVTTTGSLPVAVVGTVPVSLASQVQVSNFPATQNVSGSVTIGSWANNVTGTVSGTVGAVIENWPSTLGVSGSVSLAGAQPTFNQGTVGVSGTVGVNNFPATQNVSGSVTVGGYGVGVTGSTFITTTGSLPVAVVGTVPVSVASQVQVSNFPATQNVSGSITVGTWGTNVTGSVTGTVALTGPGSSQATPLWVTGSTGTGGSSGGSVTQGTTPWVVSNSGPQPVFNPAAVGVSGTVGVNNFPQTQNVSGSVTVGGYGVGVTGSVFITSTGSIPVTFSGLPQLQVSNFPATQNVSGTVGAVVQNWPLTLNVSGTVGVNNFPLTQNVSGSVTVTNLSASQIPNVIPAIQTITARDTNSVTSAGGINGQVLISGSATAGSTATYPVGAYSTAAVFFTGTFQGTLVPEVSMDGGGTWVPTTFYVVGTKQFADEFKFTSITFQFGMGTVDVAAATHFRARSVDPWSGTAFITCILSNNESRPQQLNAQGAYPAGQTPSLTNTPWTINPILMGGIDNANTVRNVLTDTSGRLSITSTSMTVINPATVGVSGTVGINNFPLTQGVSGSVSLAGPQPVFNAGPVGVSGTIRTWDGGTQGVSGTVTVGGYSVGVTGSTFVTVTGSTGLAVSVQNVPTVTVSNSQLQTQIQGNSDNQGTVRQVAVIDNQGNDNNDSALLVGIASYANDVFANCTGTQAEGQSAGSTAPVLIGGKWLSGSALTPIVRMARLDQSGSVYVTTSGSIPVTVAQTLAVSMSNGQMIVSIAGTPSVTFAGAQQVFNAGTVGVSGTVGINNFPLTQNVSGSITLGTWGTNVTGSVFITSTGSIPVTFGSLPQLQVSNFPATQAVSGNVSIAYQLGVTGTNFVTTTGSVGLQVAAPQAQPLWITGSVGLNPTISVSATTTTTGTAGLAVGNASYQPLFVSATSTGSLATAMQSQKAVVSSNNSSTANLTVGSSFTGASDAVLGLAGANVSIRADQNLMVSVQQSQDNANWDVQDAYVVFANVGDARTVKLAASFVRVVVTNVGQGTTTFLRLQTVLLPTVETIPRNMGGVSVFGPGYLRVQESANQLLVDTFDTGFTDTANRWRAAQTSGAGVVTTNSSGSVMVNGGSTANGYAYVQTQNAFRPTHPGWLMNEVIVSVPNPVTTASYGFWGLGYTPKDLIAVAPTAAAPMYEAAGFEMTLAGKLVVVCYASGSRNVIADLSAATGLGKQPADSNPHKYITYWRGDQAYWCIDQEDNVVAVMPNGVPGPNWNTLPCTVLSVVGTGSVTTGLVLTVPSVVVADTARNGNTINDGTYGWRTATVKAGSTAAAASDGALVVASHPSSPSYASVTGSAGLMVGAPPYNPVYIAVSGNLPVVPGDGGAAWPSTCTVTGATGLMVGSSQVLPVFTSNITSTTSSYLAVSGSTASKVLVQANFNRRGLSVYNDDNSPSNAFLLFGSGTVTPTTYHVRLNPGSAYESNFYSGPICYTWDGTSGSLYFAEFTP